MTARGICPGCRTEQDVTSAGLIGPHSARMSIYPCPGARSKPRDGKAWLLCPRCQRQIETSGSARVVPKHFRLPGGRLCEGSLADLGSSKETVVVDDATIQRIADDMAKKMRAAAMMVPPMMGGGAGGTSYSNRLVQSPRRAVRKTAAEAEADTKPAVTEACRGGDEPAAGCKDCGDVMFMRTTGQDENLITHSYEWWRKQHIAHGTDWAKERMLDFMRDEHQGVLDPEWTGEEKPLPWERKPVKKVPPVIPALSVVWMALAGVDLGLYASSGKIVYLFCVVMYIAVTFNQMRHTSKRRKVIQDNREGRMIPR